MLKIFSTLLRGAAAEAEQAVFDANAIRILEQQLRDAADALDYSKRELACAMAHRASEARASQALSLRVAELEIAASEIRCLELRETFLREEHVDVGREALIPMGTQGHGPDDGVIDAELRQSSCDLGCGFVQR